MKTISTQSFRVTALLAFLAMFTTISTIAGCSPSNGTTNVAADADQEAIDNYNRLIQEEADRVKNSVEKKDI